MGFTSAELDGFQQFARSQLESGANNISLEECLRRWRKVDDDRDAAIADIRQGIADEQAGRVRPLAEIVEEIQQGLGFPA